MMDSETSFLPQRRRKVRTTVPREGMELAIGQGEWERAEPVTFGQLFQQRVQEFPTVAALNWKERSEEESENVWKTATYAEYYRSCFDAAKFLLKVSIPRNIKINGLITIDWPGGKSWCWYHRLQFSRVVHLQQCRNICWVRHPKTITLTLYQRLLLNAVA